MTNYINPHTRNGGSKQLVIPRREHGGDLLEAPFDDTQYVRENGEWVPITFPVPELLPEPVVFLAVNGSENVTASTWTDVGSSRDVSLSRALMAMVVLKGLPLGGASTWIRVRLSWTGATAGNSYTLLGDNFAGCLNGVGNTVRDDSTLTFPLAINSGTTTFRVQAQRQSGSATSTIADTSIVIAPIAWADEYDV